MVKPFPVIFDGTAKYWSKRSCHTPLVLEEDYCGKLYREGLYSGFCVFQNIRNVLPGDIVIDREWRGQYIHCLGCRARLGMKYIQVPREKVGELYQSGRFVLKMEKVCFNDGSHMLENADAGVPVQDYYCRLDKIEQREADTDSAKWVYLNVGGKKFTTTIDTLIRCEPCSMLAAMFSGKYKLKKEKGYVLIDRDESYFAYILKWLRDGIVPILEQDRYPELLVEAEFYELEGLKSAILVVLQHKADLSRKEVIELILSGKKMFVGFNLSGVDLSKLDLADADFNGACLQNASFDGTILTKAKLQNCDAQGTSFVGALLKGSNLSKGNYSGASFLSSNLHSCNMTRANLSATDFTGADLCGVEAWKSTFNGANCERAIFKRATLNGVSFNDAKLCGAECDGAQFNNSSFLKADLTNANMQNADLTDVKLSEANLQNANMKNAKLSGMNYQIARDRGTLM